MIPMEMRGRQAKLVSAVDTAEVVDAVSNDAVGYLNADGVEEETTWTCTYPELFKGELV